MMEQSIQPTLIAASYGKRFLNYIIDTLIYEIGMFVIINPLYRFFLGKTITSYYCVNWLFALLILYLYYFLFETIFQRTPAKFITGTKVIMEDGSKPNSGVIAKRTLSRFVPFEAISMYTGSLPEKKRTWWHDRWAKTRVIRI